MRTLPMSSVWFDPVYLGDSDGQLVSEWRSCVEIDCPPTINVPAVILPPTKPSVLKLLIELKGLKGSDYSGASAHEIAKYLGYGLSFWEDQLLYGTQISVSGNIITLDLQCKVWNPDKILTLLQKPAERRLHMKNLPQVHFLKQLRVLATLCSPDDGSIAAKVLVPQLNEYLGSLFFSQLEFRYPFVFCMTARKRFLAQESSIGPISYALTNSSAILPVLTKLIGDDLTATTAHQLIAVGKRKIKDVSFQIAQLERQ